MLSWAHMSPQIREYAPPPLDRIFLFSGPSEGEILDRWGQFSKNAKIPQKRGPFGGVFYSLYSLWQGGMPCFDFTMVEKTNYQIFLSDGNWKMELDASNESWSWNSYPCVWLKYAWSNRKSGGTTGHAQVWRARWLYYRTKKSSPRGGVIAGCT